MKFWAHSIKRHLCTTQKVQVKLKEIIEFDNGKTLLIESGEYAKLADGSAVASIGNTSVLVTSVSKYHHGSVPSFLPLTVDYRQKYAAAGKIPSNFLRREMAPTEKEILTSRVIDRSIRPLFPSKYMNDTQLTCHLLAVDGLQEPDVVAINAASASLSLSNIPWNGPIGAVRVGIIDGEPVTFPTQKELQISDLNLIISATSKSLIVMLEGSGLPVSVQELKEAIKHGVRECQRIIESIEMLVTQIDIIKRDYTVTTDPPQDLIAAVRCLAYIGVREIFCDFSHDKLSRDNALNNLRTDVLKKVSESYGEMDSTHFHEIFNVVCSDAFRALIMDENIRCDGRAPTDLRPISCSIDLFKPLHGSSLFQRGQTQVQCTVAYDSPDKAVQIDSLLDFTGRLSNRNFLLHYAFPSYANNEISRSGPISRREVGHGALAAKGLRPLIPKETPFCILLSSTVMESNGSSSMATVCGASLALMDAGVAIPTHASGVAVGLVTRCGAGGDIEDYKLLIDILGLEDYLGDMDFKIAGTKDGITALQADIKLPGVPYHIILEAIDAGVRANQSILQVMCSTISEPRKDKRNLPIFRTKEIPPQKRGLLIGPGGFNLKRIQAQTGVQVSWEDAQTISLFATNKESMEEALLLVDECMEKEPEMQFGAIYTAKIVEVRPQGVMITFYEGMQPILLHNSQLDVRKVDHPSALNMTEGNEIKVKYFGRDPTSGQMRISRKAILLSKLPTIKKL